MVRRGSTGGNQRLWSKWTGLGNQRSLFGFFNNSNNLVFTKSNDGSATQGNTSDNTFTDTTNWYYIVITYDGTVVDYNDAVKFYVNGSEEPQTATTSSMSAIFQTSEDLVIGMNTSSGGSPANLFDGDVRDFAIHSDVLTSAQVLSRYANGNINAPNTDNLLLHPWIVTGKQIF